MEIKVNNELKYTELIMEENVEYKEDYQIPMIRENKIEGLLKVAGRGYDNRSQYMYDISGYQTMQQRFEHSKLDGIQLKIFLTQLAQMLDLLGKYMLNVNCILLDPNHIYYKNSRYHFCYFPPKKELIMEGFHALTEYFVKTIDYSDTNSVIMACGLHKETMEEGYSLEKLLEKNVVAKEETLWEEEEGDEWEPPKEAPWKRFLGKRRKEKWGSWDNLLRGGESSIMKEK